MEQCHNGVWHWCPAHEVGEMRAVKCQLSKGEGSGTWLRCGVSGFLVAGLGS